MSACRSRFTLVAALLSLSLPAFGEPHEVNVSRDPAVRDGEPALASNPNDPANLVIAWMKSTPSTFSFGNGGQCAVSATFDGGETWSNQVLPLRDALYPICADPVLVSAADGSFYMGAIAFNWSFQVGRTVVTRSTDGGRTWSPAVEAIGPSSFRPGDASTIPLDGFDRPWLAVDDARGALYLTTMTIFSRPMGPLAHRYLVASHDQGRTWGRPQMVDSPDYPADHWATGTMSVAPDGTVAIAYTARDVPEAGRRCPCAVLATTNDGVSFRRHTVPFGETMLGISLPEQDEPSLLRLVYGPMVAADPTRPGRYAVAVTGWKGVVAYQLGQVGVAPQTRVEIQLFLTEDSGVTWTGPASLGEDPAKDREHVWLAYSPAGVLGVIWRTHTGACCFGSTTVWSVVSRDGGTTFEPARKLSQAESPFTGLLGDDYQSVVVDGSSLHAAWGDARSGDVDVYHARLPIDGT